MKVSTLKKHISPLRKMITKNPVIPVLSSVLFSGSKIQATDLVNYMTVDVEEILTDVDFLLDFSILSKILSSAKGSYEISFQANEAKVTVMVGDYRFNLDVDPVGDYPNFIDPNIEGDEIDFLDRSSVLEAIPFASDNELRPDMTGVLIGEDIAATDAHRLFWKPAKSQMKDSVIIDRKCAGLLSFFDEPKLRYNKKHVVFFEGGKTLVSRVIYEVYPEYQRVIPTEFFFELSVETKALREAIEMVKITANSYTHQIILTIQSGSMKIESQCIDYGLDSEVRISVQENSPHAYRIGFSANLLLSCLAGDTVTLKFQDKNTLAVVVNDCMIVMPVAIESMIGI